MNQSQPTPFEVKRGILVDAVGRPIDFDNKENLKTIAKATQDAAELEDVQDELDDALLAAEEHERETTRLDDELTAANADADKAEDELKKIKEKLGEIKELIEKLT